MRKFWRFLQKRISKSNSSQETPQTTRMSGDWRAMVIAVEKGDFPSVFDYVVNKKVDCNFQHPEIGTSALLMAVKHNQLEIVRLLVEKGNANVNMEADVFSEGSPASVAKILGFQDIETYLVSKGGIYSNVQVTPSKQSNKCIII